MCSASKVERNHARAIRLFALDFLISITRQKARAHNLICKQNATKRNAPLAGQPAIRRFFFFRPGERERKKTGYKRKGEGLIPGY